MTDTGNLYSRVIAWVKILLPLAALGLLSALFLLARGPDESETLPFTQVELKELARDQGILSPHYTGVTDDGRALSFEAARAVPRANDRTVVDATDVRAELESQRGDDIHLRSATAIIDTSAGFADLGGGVEIETAQGHTVVTDGLRTALERTDMQSTGPATFTGPNFHAEAGRFSVRTSPDDPDSLIAVFNDGIRLIYDPKAPHE